MLRDDLGERHAEFERKLHALRIERRRLDELSHAYTVTERSKFAVLRSVWRGFRTLVSRPQHVTRAVVPAPPDVDVERMLRQLQHDRDRLYELVENSKIDDRYVEWMAANALRDCDIHRLRGVVAALRYRPLLSIIVPAYNTPDRYLRAMLDSVLFQVYPDWELCIADDKSTEAHVRTTLTEYAARDSRIKVVFRDSNGHISAATNSALDIATGEFAGFLDHDDLLTPDALFEVAMLLGKHPDADMIYSDEDKIDEHGNRSDPHFKPDWSPESYLSRNYTSHFSVYRRTLVDEIGRMREGFEGSQDYDLALRLTERTDRVYHIPRVLYHWRVHPGSTSSSTSAKGYAFDAAQRALSEATERRGEKATIALVYEDGVYSVRFAIREEEGVSVVIPVRGDDDDIERCLTSVFEKTTYPNFDVIVVHDDSTGSGSLAKLEELARGDSRLQLLHQPGPFNVSKLVNHGVAHTNGYYVLSLAADTEVITPDWMTAMVEQGQRSPIGAVGAHLLYKNETYRHAGMIMGVGGVAGYSHRHSPGDSLGYCHTLISLMNASAVSGACLLVRRSVFHEAGGFDEALALAFGDVDFCLKIRNAGYRNVTVPYARLYHGEFDRGQPADPEEKAVVAEECALMIERWNTTRDFDPFYNVNLTRAREDWSIAG